MCNCSKKKKHTLLYEQYVYEQTISKIKSLTLLYLRYVFLRRENTTFGKRQKTVCQRALT